MLKSRSMAIFTLDHVMAEGANLLILFGVAIPAVFLPLVFRLKGFPLPFVGLPIPAIHVATFMGAEILGHDEGPGD
jgi:hypothetical protein